MTGNAILLSLLLLSNLISAPVNIFEDLDMDIVAEYDIRLFNTTSVEGLRDFLGHSSIDQREYNRSTYNCVNFSSDLISELELYGFNASNTRMHKEYGTKITDDMHMIVAIKLSDKIVFVEPQTDTILTYNGLEQHYSDNGFTDIVIYDLFGMSTIISFDGYISDDLKNMFEVET